MSESQIARTESSRIAIGSCTAGSEIAKTWLGRSSVEGSQCNARVWFIGIRQSTRPRDGPDAMSAWSEDCARSAWSRSGAARLGSINPAYDRSALIQSAWISIGLPWRGVKVTPFRCASIQVSCVSSLPATTSPSAGSTRMLWIVPVEYARMMSAHASSSSDGSGFPVALHHWAHA